MLRLQKIRPGALLRPVGEAHLVIVCKNRLRRHFRDAVIGHHGFLIRRREIILDMALPAGERRRIDLLRAVSQRLVHIRVRDHDLPGISRVVPVAIIAADVFLHQRHRLVEGNGISPDAHVVNELGEVRRLAGQAVRVRVRALCPGDILERIFVPPGAAVILRKAIALVNIDEVRILLQIGCYIAVFPVVSHGRHDLRVNHRPVRGLDRAVLAGGRRGVRLKILDVFS